ncbi:tRNA (adenosine(37)-N6)-threonylcarbamoyltransferase complex ATPase subunit type 1 TsaE [Nitrosophilus labii]|uniref:tRNA (adenosine(37)-N6)-threonylcarbamoyltransferase complex ATPase subunit type 1 TsaE n=1 Tax=Nitrosophilus labii TaxID=2706014 RepID=UPI00165710DF|nr:tRNA (adenosine(37)-N6)-threonylcarbamoyltransferase complex ATPase subunit type 1 TsaE [Nitrosophilus labii]
MEKTFILAEYELNILLDFLDEKLKNNKIVLLKGNLGSGKTTLVKEFAKKRGVEEATSPTFSIQQVYEGDIYHYDLYQTSFEKFLELGLFDELEKEGVHFIEWADENLENLLKMAGFKYIIIDIKTKEDKRVYKVSDA